MNHNMLGMEPEFRKEELQGPGYQSFLSTKRETQSCGQICKLQGTYFKCARLLILGKCAQVAQQHLSFGDAGPLPGACVLFWVHLCIRCRA